MEKTLRLPNFSEEVRMRKGMPPSRPLCSARAGERQGTSWGRQGRSLPPSETSLRGPFCAVISSNALLVP